MTNKMWEKISYWFGLMPIGALMGVAVYAASIEIKDFDLWLHLATGRFIVQNGYVPLVDVLSFSIADKPWINHEWLFQVLVYQIYNAFGHDGLIKMQIVVVSLTLTILFLLGWSREKYLVTTFGLILMFLCYQQRFTIRPDIFSLLFFSLYIYALALYIDKRWIVPFLILIQILWSNMHGFFFFGPLFVAIGLISEWIKRNVNLPYEWNEAGRLSDEEYKRLKFIFVGVVLACLVNPQGFKGAWYPISVFFSLGGESKIFFKYIQELEKPVHTHNLFAINEYVFYKLMIVASLFSFFFNRRRIDISAFIFWLIFLLFSLNAVRNAAFFGFAGYLVIITNFISISYRDFTPFRFTDKRFESITGIFISLLFVAWLFNYGKMISVRSYYDFDAYKYKSEFWGVGQRNFPNKAADFIVENNLKGNFFNDFNSGAYLLGRAHPNVKVFIDGRTEVYGAEFFTRYQKMWVDGDAKLLDETLEKFQVAGALLNSSVSLIPPPILKYFHKKEGWKLVYLDYDGVIFLKEISQNEEIIRRYSIDFKKWQPQDFDFFKFSTTRAIPYQHYARAYTLFNLELFDLAFQEAERAVKINPQYPEPYHLLGQIWIQRKDYQKAFENFRIAAMLDPLDKKIRYSLAHVYLDLKEYKGAIEQYLAILEGWPAEVEARFRLAQAYAHDKQADKAFIYIDQMIKVNPQSLGDVLLVGDIFYDNVMPKEAIAVYEKVKALDPKGAMAYKKIARAELASGNKESAVLNIKKALAIKPDDKEIQELHAQIQKMDN